MKMIGVLYRKELKCFFLSPLFFLVAFLTTLILSITFSMSLQNFAATQSQALFDMGVSAQRTNIHYSVFLPHLSLLNLILMFLIPALAMRLISEEKKMRTFDLLLTCPLTSYEIVIGKYLALLTVVLSLSGLASIYILIARKMFEFNWAPTLTALAGIILVGAVYSAICLFASSLTENTLISFSLGIVFNMLVWIFGGLAEVSDQLFLRSIFEQISLNMHLQTMIEGVVKLNGVVFIFSLIFLFGFLTERIIESARWRAL